MKAWCWHQWPKWGPVKAQPITSWRRIEGVEYYQQRECAKCGQVRQREVKY